MSKFSSHKELQFLPNGQKVPTERCTDPAASWLAELTRCSLCRHSISTRQSATFSEAAVNGGDDALELKWEEAARYKIKKGTKSVIDDRVCVCVSLSEESDQSHFGNWHPNGSAFPHEGKDAHPVRPAWWNSLSQSWNAAGGEVDTVGSRVASAAFASQKIFHHHKKWIFKFLPSKKNNNFTFAS